MSFHQVYSDTQDGGDRVWLGTLGQVSGLQWSWVWPGGPEKASFKFWRDARYQHRALRQGRTIGICVSASKVLTGELVRPGRGDPWEVEVNGLAVLGNNYVADAPTSGNPFNLNEIIDEAISRGLPWKTRPNLPSGTGDNSDDPAASERLTVAAALSRVLPESTTTWHVDAEGRLFRDAATPTDPTHIMLTDDPARGRAPTGEYLSALYVIYNDADTGTIETVWARDPLSETARPPVERFSDLTGRGKMTGTQAQNLGYARLGMHGRRAPWADSFTFARGMIRNRYGSVIDPAVIRPPMLARLMLTDPDHAAETNYGAVTDFLVRRTTYNDDTDTVEVEPFDLHKTDLKSLLAGVAQ